MAIKTWSATNNLKNLQKFEKTLDKFDRLC